MYESSAVWTFIGPDGSAVTFNDGGLYICEDVTGFDSPNVRENIEELPETDGAAAGDFFYGARPVTFNGLLVGDPGARNLAAVQLQAALRGLRGDVTVKSQATGLPAMQVTGRLQNLRITRREGIAKNFQIGMICADPRIYSQATGTNSGTGSTAISGAAFPLVFDINFGGGTGATVAFNVTNAGNFTAPVTIRVTGTIDNPQVRNNTTGESIYLDNLSLVNPEYVDINTLARTVVKSDGTDLYGKVRIPASHWWYLIPGANNIELRSASASSSGTLQVSWRDSWA